jgi:hypothetical protein
LKQNCGVRRGCGDGFDILGGDDEGEEDGRGEAVLQKYLASSTVMSVYRQDASWKLQFSNVKVMMLEMPLSTLVGSMMSAQTGRLSRYARKARRALTAA